MQSGRRLTDLEPAGFAKRAAAFVIDLGVAGIALVLLLQLVLDPLRQALGPAWARVGWFYLGYAILTVSLPMWLYFAGYESSERRATPGKRWLGLAVTSTAAAPVSFGRALLRTLLKLMPVEVAHFCIAIPANPFIDPLSGALIVPALGSLGASVLIGLLVSVLIFAGLLFSVLLHPDGRGAHDLLARTFVVGMDADVAPTPAPAMQGGGAA